MVECQNYVHVCIHFIIKILASGKVLWTANNGIQASERKGNMLKYRCNSNTIEPHKWQELENHQKSKTQAFSLSRLYFCFLFIIFPNMHDLIPSFVHGKNVNRTQCLVIAILVFITHFCNLPQTSGKLPKERKCPMNSNREFAVRCIYNSSWKIHSLRSDKK